MRDEQPMNTSMNATIASETPKHGASEHLLRHCLALGGVGRDRRSPRVRLEEAVGPELARRLLASITISPRRR